MSKHEGLFALHGRYVPHDADHYDDGNRSVAFSEDPIYDTIYEAKKAAYKMGNILSLKVLRVETTKTVVYDEDS